MIHKNKNKKCVKGQETKKVKIINIECQKKHPIQEVDSCAIIICKNGTFPKS